MLKIFLIIISFGLLVNNVAFAQRTVPKVPPLQPVNIVEPEGVTEDINSEGSPFYQDPNLIPEPGGEEIEETPSNETADPAPISTVGDVDPPPTATYWILMFVGLAGLIIVGGWLYWRYLRIR